MTPRILHELVVIPTLDWLADFTPIRSGPAGCAMLGAIAWQESELKRRVQVVKSSDGGLVEAGPARSWWQMERIAVTEVMQNPRTKNIAQVVCEALRMPATPAAVHQNIALNDQLACAFARLNLWLDPNSLPQPKRANEEEAWKTYLRAWRPGKPHWPRWSVAWAQAVATSPAA